MITSIIALLSSGAGGGLLGGIFGLFKQSQERKERVEMARIEKERDELEYRAAADERAHALAMLERSAELKLEEAQIMGALKLETVQTETEAEIEVAHQKALGKAQGVFDKLKTSQGMDNFRASVRPTLAYWFALLFSVMLAWAFSEFHATIDAKAGRELLLGMFATLTFLVTSIGTFYYVSRRNSAPRV